MERWWWWERKPVSDKPFFAQARPRGRSASARGACRAGTRAAQHQREEDARVRRPRPSMRRPGRAFRPCQPPHARKIVKRGRAAFVVPARLLAAPRSNRNVRPRGAEQAAAARGPTAGGNRAARPRRGLRGAAPRQKLASRGTSPSRAPR
jgi:hypothetical protein